MSDLQLSAVRSTPPSAPPADHPASVRVSDGPGGLEAFLRGRDGQWVRLHSGRNPVGEAAAWLERELAGAPIPEFLVIVGAGLGYVLEILESRRADVRVLVLEPEPALAEALLARRDWSGWQRDGRLTVLPGPDYAGQGDAWRQVPSPERTWPVLVHPVLRRERPDAVKSAQSVAARILFDARANADSRAALAGTYLLHTLASVGVIAREGDAGTLFGAFAGVPAIVIGAGPSLDRNLDALATVGDRALIIAADTALRPLLAAGISPHLVVAADPSDHNARHLQDLPPCDATWLVAEGSVGSQAFEAFAGRTFVFRLGGHEPWPWLESLGLARAPLRAWGSVVTSAFDLAIRAGCDPIVFAGLDLAFTGQQPYCRGTTWELDRARELARGEQPASLEQSWRESIGRWKLVTETGIDGQPVKTAPHLQAFRNWIIEQTPGLGRRIVNGTGAGILSGGTIEQQELGAALRDLLPTGPIDLEARLRGAHGRRASVDTGRLQREVTSTVAAAAEPDSSEHLRAWVAFARDVEPAAMTAALEQARRTIQAPSSIRRTSAGDARSPVPLPPPLNAIRIPPPECAAIIRATIDGTPLPAWVRRSSGVRIPDQLDPTRLGQAIEQALRTERPSFERLEQLLAAVAWRADGTCANAAEFKLLAMFLMQRRRGDVSRPITGLLSLSPWPARDSEDAAAPAARSHDRRRPSGGLLDAVLGHVAPDAMAWLEARVLTDEIGRCVSAAQVGDSHAMLTPLGALHSTRVAEDGAHQPMPAWPKPVVAEAPWGSDGGALAWNNGDEPYLMWRRAAGADVAIEPLPFQPGAAVLRQPDGTALFPSYRGGLWEWRPGGGARRLIETPPVVGISRQAGAIRLDPAERDEADQPIRRPAREAWLWTPGSAVLTPMRLGPLGQRWAEDSAGGWRASAWPHADVVTLRHVSGAEVLLGCDYPAALAWAGRSLLVTSCWGDVLLFPKLRDLLDAALTERTLNG